MSCFGPIKLTVQCNLEGSGGQEVRLQHITKEEGHQTGEDLTNRQVTLWGPSKQVKCTLRSTGEPYHDNTGIFLI